MTQLGKYDLHEELGRGGFGAVYRATDTTLGREVALKVLHPQLTTDPDFLEKFRKEARTVAQLESRDIVTIYELGELDGRIFISMQFMSGGSLKEKLEKEGALSFEETLKIMRQVCEGLQVAHEQGLVHRDIKPANILFDNKGNAVINDFGLAKAISNSSVSAMSSMGGVGTPAYRAPELWLDHEPSFATDIYSLGCVLYEMMIGKVLFDAKTPDGVITQHLVTGPQLTDPLEVEGAGDIRAVIAGCLMKDPAQRYGKLTTLLAALELPKQNEARETVPDLETKGCEPAQAKAAQETPLDVSVPIQTRTEDSHLGIGSTRVSEKDGMIMVYVPEGEFLMGSREDDDLAYEDEKPQHSVYLDAYWIDQTPVTNAMFVQFLNEQGDKGEAVKSWVQTGIFTDGKIKKNKNGWQVEEGYADHPVVNVTWHGARAYAKWAGRELPSEAQWEKAARGTDGRTYPWGEGIDCNRANYRGCIGGTSPVGSFPTGASPYGALDMAGNVWEWVADWYNENYYSTSPNSNPSGPNNGEYRVVRGGSWNLNERLARSAHRDLYYPDFAVNVNGFRCARLP